MKLPDKEDVTTYVIMLMVVPLIIAMIIMLMHIVVSAFI